MDILASTLSPLINALYHTLMMDNDPKHIHLGMQQHAWMNANGINWWRTPAESPDINPIENLWHELKEYQRRVVKPKTRKQELINGIAAAFWRTVDKEKCCKHIGHIKKVIPKVMN